MDRKRTFRKSRARLGLPGRSGWHERGCGFRFEAWAFRRFPCKKLDGEAGLWVVTGERGKWGKGPRDGKKRVVVNVTDRT
ncbi:hypothetical protein MPNT_100046 [Candidatus Methylacidithermus pantelleriae]|uniref:Uncharacterized protein n=1 Tax=Candidatus Methylacidithermus pantelleriae TaxID=2744239 RepID=A0A8J2BM84_9BACT|nr:hypothetical protein MPNT_100046 [Candidatus Methylacidithermus pantelleriae]